MPDFRIRLSQTVFYACVVQAESYDAAYDEVRDAIEAGLGEDLDLYEVDSTDFVVGYK